MGRLSDALTSILGLLVTPLTQRHRKARDAWIQESRLSRVSEALPEREPPRPWWNPDDAAAPDWSLRMDTISLPPGPGTRPKVVLVDLWSAGHGRYVAGDPRDARAPVTDLPPSTARALLKMAGDSFPEGFHDFDAFQRGAVVFFDGTPATLTVFRRRPYTLVQAHTNLGFIGEFEGEVPAPPVLEMCELLSRLHQIGYRPG